MAYVQVPGRPHLGTTRACLLSCLVRLATYCMFGQLCACPICLCLVLRYQPNDPMYQSPKTRIVLRSPVILTAQSSALIRVSAPLRISLSPHVPRTRQLERPFPSPIKPVPILRVGSVGSVLPLHCKAKPAVPPSPRSWAWTPRKVPEPMTPSRPKASAPRSPERGAPFTPPRPERKAEYVTVTVPEPPEPVKSEKVPEPPVPPPPKIPVITHPHYAIRRQVCQQVLLTNLPVGVEEHHIVRQLDTAGLEQPFVVQVNQAASTCTLFYPQVSKSADMLVEERLA